MNRAKFKVSHRLLEKLLRLPENAHILYVNQKIDDIGAGVFEVHVTHPDLPETPEGASAIECNPTFSQYEDGTVEFTSW